MTTSRSTNDAASESALLYDPDPVNPYGSELRRTLDGLVSIEHWGAVGSTQYAGPKITKLATVRSRVGTLRAVMLRVTGPLGFVKRGLRDRQSLVIAAWCTTTVDMLTLLILMSRGSRVVVVDHNPIPARQAAGYRSRLKRAVLKRAAAVVVHESWMVRHVQDFSPGTTVAVICHPSYAGWVNSHVPRRAPSQPEVTALLLGNLRQDKGVTLIPDLAHKFRARGAALLVASRIPAGLDLGDPAALHPRSILQVSSPVDDVDLGQMLAMSDVVVGPYIDVTTSGSLILALSAGLHAVAFDSEGVRALGPTVHCVPMGAINQMVEVASLLYLEPKDAVARALRFCQKRDAACKTGWAELTRSLSDAGR